MLVRRELGFVVGSGGRNKEIKRLLVWGFREERRLMKDYVKIV